MESFKNYILEKLKISKDKSNTEWAQLIEKVYEICKRKNDRKQYAVWFFLSDFKKKQGIKDEINIVYDGFNYDLKSLCVYETDNAKLLSKQILLCQCDRDGQSLELSFFEDEFIDGIGEELYQELYTYIMEQPNAEA